MSLTQTVPVSNYCTLCLVKPHVVSERLAGALLNRICDAGYNLSAVFSVHLNVPMAEELFDVYKGLFPNYSAMIHSICKGPCLAAMITGDEGLITDFRQFCGPLEPELARLIRPKSLRALFGKSVVENAVHCTDLEDDKDLECKFFFDTVGSL